MEFINKPVKNRLQARKKKVKIITRWSAFNTNFLNALILRLDGRTVRASAKVLDVRRLKTTFLWIDLIKVLEIVRERERQREREKHNSLDVDDGDEDELGNTYLLYVQVGKYTKTLLL